MGKCVFGRVIRNRTPTMITQIDRRQTLDGRNSSQRRAAGVGSEYNTVFPPRRMNHTWLNSS